MRTSWLLPLLPLVAATPLGQQLPIVPAGVFHPLEDAKSPPPPSASAQQHHEDHRHTGVYPADSNLIFASFSGLLKQWTNTFYSNGFSVIAGVIPRGTLLYHARKTADLPPPIEWLAFDQEMSLGIMQGRGGYTQLLTYATARPMRIIYLDGESAALSRPGWLDSQSVLMYGNVTKIGDRPGPEWGGGEYLRAQAFCQMGDEWGFDAVVRMNTGFEIMYCDFGGKGLDLVSRLNVTDPHTPGPGFGFPAPPDAPYPDPTSVTTAQDGPIFPDEPHRGPDPFPGHGGPYGSRPYGRRPDGMFPTSPFGGTAHWEWQRSASWHYSTPGESRVILDYSTFVTFYDPRVTSLVASRKEQGIETDRARQRLLDIEQKEGLEVKQRVRETIRSMNRKGWTIDASDRVDWGAIADTVENFYSGRLAELNYILRNDSSANATTTAVQVRGLAYVLLAGYLDFSAYSNTSTKWIDSSVQQRCTTSFTSFAPSHSSSESLIRSSIEGVLNHTCHDIISIFKDTILLPLPLEIGGNLTVPSASLERDSAIAVRNWRARVEGLMTWLGWASWFRCEEVCAWDEVCSIPMWPVGGMGPPGRGDQEPTKIVPKCVSRDSGGRRR